MDPEDPMDPEDEVSSLEIEVEVEIEDGPASSDEIREEFEPEGFERWRRESAVGAVGTGIARGLQNVFAPPPNQPMMVASVPGDPPDPERLQVVLDPDDPSKSVALLPPSAAPPSAAPPSADPPSPHSDDAPA
jgi:hypothetical protein